MLLKAHRLVGIVDPSPPIQFGIYRLLIAFLMDALDMRSIDDVAARLHEQSLSEAELRRYIDHVGADRFDLFHLEYPFLQTPPMADDESRLKSVASMFFHLPTGTNTTHFNHVAEDAHAISPAVCARALCAVAPFMTAGGAGYSPSINGTPPWYVLLRGNNLYETLLLNCFVMDSLGLDRDGKTPWRTGRPVTPRQQAGCDSLVEGLTWQPRQMRLIPGDGGACTYTGQGAPILIRRMVFGPGAKFSGGDAWTDPNAAYKTTDKGRLPLRPQVGRSLWRDMGPLLLLRKDEYSSANGKVTFSRPLAVEQYNAMKMKRVIGRDAPIRIEVYGMRADKAKIFEWQYERMHLPAKVAEAYQAGKQVQNALDRADSVAYALRKAIKEAYPRQGKGNQKAFESVVVAAEQRFWDRLHLRFREQFLAGLATQDPNDPTAPNTLLQQWGEETRKVGWRELDATLDHLGSDAEAMARNERARSVFARLVAALVNPKKESGKQDEGRRVTHG